LDICRSSRGQSEYAVALGDCRNARPRESRLVYFVQPRRRLPHRLGKPRMNETRKTEDSRIALAVIQAPKRELGDRALRLIDREWEAITAKRAACRALTTSGFSMTFSGCCDRGAVGGFAPHHDLQSLQWLAKKPALGIG
jgi:hypothetical protein